MEGVVLLVGAVRKSARVLGSSRLCLIGFINRDLKIMRPFQSGIFLKPVIPVTVGRCGSPCERISFLRCVFSANQTHTESSDTYSHLCYLHLMCHVCFVILRAQNLPLVIFSYIIIAIPLFLFTSVPPSKLFFYLFFSAHFFPFLNHDLLFTV